MNRKFAIFCYAFRELVLSLGTGIGIVLAFFRFYVFRRLREITTNLLPQWK